MYNQTGTLTKVAGSVAASTAGIALLPATQGNTIGLILAYGAIAIGIIALLSQATLRIMRYYYQTRTK